MPSGRLIRIHPGRPEEGDTADPDPASTRMPDLSAPYVARSLPAIISPSDLWS